MMSSGLTVCVTGAGAGMDNVREQEKLEARKMLENAAESHTSGARLYPLAWIGKIQTSYFPLCLLQPTIMPEGRTHAVVDAFPTIFVGYIRLYP
jgi:hypothetical protein